jgi:hypothetical protein
MSAQMRLGAYLGLNAEACAPKFGQSLRALPEPTQRLLLASATAGAMVDMTRRLRDGPSVPLPSPDTLDLSRAKDRTS